MGSKKINLVMWVSLIGIFIIGYLVYRSKSGSNKSETANKTIGHHGPFSIQIQSSSYKQYNQNTGRKHKESLIKYSILYKEKPFVFSNNLQNNTGFSHLWRVYILMDASTPTLIAGSQSIYLITEKDGALQIDPLDQQGYDFATLQWLDADHGQPSSPLSLFMNNDTSTSIKPDTLQGGNYLLVNNHAVLQLQDLKIYPVNKNNEPVSNYSYGSQALAFSPDSSSIIFTGDFQTWNTNSVPVYPMALIVHNISTNTGYALPFSKNQTKVYNSSEITPSWFKTYFEWNKKGNGLILEQKKLEHPVPWQGTFALMSSDATEYHLYPVTAALLPVLKDFILAHLHWGQAEILGAEKEKENHFGDIYSMGKDKIKFELSFHDSKISLYRTLPNESEKETYEQIIILGKAFNAYLQQENYQQYFTSIPENEN